MSEIARVNGLIGTLGIKAPVRAASTGNVVLSGEQTQDGVALVEGDRFLAKDQLNTIENGIYDVHTGAWTRSPDFDGTRDIVRGTALNVFAGVINAGTQWHVSTDSASIIPGVTALAFELTFGPYVPAVSVTVSAFDFMTPTQKASVMAYDYLVDVTEALNEAFAQENRMVKLPAGGYRCLGLLRPPTCVGIEGEGWAPSNDFTHGTIISIAGAVGIDLRNRNCTVLRDFCILGGPLANAVGLMVGNGPSNLSATFTGSISDWTLTASAVTGTIEVGQAVSGTGVRRGTYIQSQLTGAPGGAGTYSLSSFYPQTIASEAMSSAGLYTWDYGTIDNIRITNFTGAGAFGMHLRNANFLSSTGLHLDNNTVNFKASVAQPGAGTVPADCWFDDFTASSSGAESVLIGSGYLIFKTPRIYGTTKEAMIIDPALADGTHPAVVTMLSLGTENIYAENVAQYQIRVKGTAILSSLHLSGGGSVETAPMLINADGAYATVHLAGAFSGIRPSPANANWIKAQNGARINIDGWAATDGPGQSSTAVTGGIITSGLSGLGQTYQDVTASRVLGTTYTNTTGAPIGVSVWGTGDGSGASGFIGYVDGVFVAMGALAKTAGSDSSLYFMVPPGKSYKVASNSGASTVVKWFEMRHA